MLSANRLKSVNCLTSGRCYATTLRGGFAKRRAQKLVEQDDENAPDDAKLTSPQEDRVATWAMQQPLIRKSRRQKKPLSDAARQRKRVTHVTLPQYPTAKSLASVFKCRTIDVLKTMIKLGETPLGGDEPLPMELAEMIAESRNIVASVPEQVVDRLTPRPRPPPDEYAKLPRRTGIGCILGHINHGKTTLLDKLRHSRRAEQEAGGITQDIAAFTVRLPEMNEYVTFVDTPGHASFGHMRERGATLTDFALLVVSAVDGVQPLTVEAINTLHEHNLPFIVVVTKCNARGAQPDAVAVALTRHNVVSESLGGDVPIVHVSVLEDSGLDALETQLYMTLEQLDLRADRDPRSAEAIVVESENAPGLGPIATVVVKRGLLAKGDSFVCGTVHGRVRQVLDSEQGIVESALPGVAVEIHGFRELPQSGDVLFVVKSEQEARKLVSAREHFLAEEQARKSFSAAAETAKEQRKLRHQRRVAELQLMDMNDPKQRGGVGSIIKEQRSIDPSFEEKLAFGRAEDKTRGHKDDSEYPKSLKILIKAESDGTCEALVNAIDALPKDPDVNVEIISHSVGELNENDLNLAITFEAEIILFGVHEPSASLTALIDQHDLRVLRADVIYRALDRVTDGVSQMLRPREKIAVEGHARVLQLFEIDGGTRRAHTVHGCVVEDGVVNRNSFVRIKHKDGTYSPAGRVKSLRHLKDIVKSVTKGVEFGAELEEMSAKVGDTIECFNVSQEPRKLGDAPAQPSIIAHLKN